MRYLRLSYRYSETLSSSGLQDLGDVWNQMSVTLARPQWRPAADLCETPSSLTVKVEIAGISEEDIEIALHENALVIEGTRSWDLCDGETQFHASEIHYGSFRLKVPLQIAIDRDRVNARYERGFLYITLPKNQG